MSAPFELAGIAEGLLDQIRSSGLAPGLSPRELTAVGLALPAFALAMAFSPGPGNMVLLSVGARSGVRHGVGFLFGMALGYAVLWGGAGSGLRFVAGLNPVAMQAARIVALGMIGWMTYRLVAGGTPSPSTGGASGAALKGFAFQFANPKAWVTAVTAAALFCTSELGVPSHAVWFGGVAMVAVIFGCGAWLVAGRLAKSVLERRSVHRAMNGVLVATLVVTAVPLVVGTNGASSMAGTDTMRVVNAAPKRPRLERPR